MPRAGYGAFTDLVRLGHETDGERLSMGRSRADARQKISSDTGPGRFFTAWGFASFLSAAFKTGVDGGVDSLKCVRCSFLFQRALVFCPKGVSCREGTRRALADWGARKTRLDGLRMRAGRRFGKGKCRLEIGAREARARKERECRGGRAASAGVMRESHCRRCLPHPLPPAGEKCSGSAGTGEGRNRHGRNSALLRAESSHGPARWERQIFSAECGLACLLNASTWPAAISSFLLWA